MILGMLIAIAVPLGFLALVRFRLGHRRWLREALGLQVGISAGESVPLLRPDPDVPLDVGEALRITYESARDDLRLNYRQPPPPPPLANEEPAWLDAHLRTAGAR